MIVTFLTPRLPPSVCGIGDHTAQMAAAMRGMIPGITAIVLHKHPGPVVHDIERVDYWNGRQASLADLLRDHKTDFLWIQYSGYGLGYQGVPWFLIRAIDALPRRPQVVVYFHETHCSPQQLGWKSIILSPLQRKVGKALANRADTLFTSTESYAQTIQHEYGMPPERITRLPLGSNIPVPMLVAQDRKAWRMELGLNENDCAALTFGSVGSQRQALMRNSELLLSAVKNGCINRILCVGGDLGMSRNDVLRGVDERVIKISTVMGYQDPERIAKTLIATDAAFVRYPFEHFGKSGALMAFSLAGLPLLVGREPPAEVNSFRGIRLLRFHDLDRNRSIPCDVDARIERQKQAREKFSWSSIARTALDSMGIVKSSSKPLHTAD